MKTVFLHVIRKMVPDLTIDTLPNIIIGSGEIDQSDYT